MFLKQWNTLQVLTVAGTAVYALLFLAMLILHPGGKHFYHAFFNVYQIFPPVFAGICGIAYALKGTHYSQTRKVGWLFIGLGCMSFGIGQITWTCYETILGKEVPFPGWADVGYLGAFPFLFCGVLMLFGSMPIVGRARLLMDGIIAAVSVGVLSWYFLMQRLWNQSDVTVLGKVIGVLYPLGDVAALLAVLVLFGGASSSKGLRRSFACVAVGLLLVTFSDTVFTYMTLNKTYQTGSWADWGWSFGWLTIGYASLLPLWWPRANAEPMETPAIERRISPLQDLFKTFSPYLAMGNSFLVVILMDYHADHQIGLSTFLVACGLILLVVLRQIFTIMENRRLTNQLRGFNTNLESIVAQRTSQLDCLHQLTKAINNSLQVDQVLAAAVEHTHNVMHADAVVLRVQEVDPATDLSHLRTRSVAGFAERPEVLVLIEILPVPEGPEMMGLPVDLRGQGKNLGAYLMAPLIWQGQARGMIGVARWDAGFEESEIQLLESIGLEVGSAFENARSYTTAKEAADLDSVTGLYNHRAIHQRLNEEFARALRIKEPLTVIMIDVNNFKLFNDTYGHPIGDEVLKRVGRVLTEESREYDIVARYGGDEFIVVLPHADSEAATALARRIASRMEGEGFRRAGEDRVIPIGMSFGIASYPIDGRNRHELLSIADANLYRAKVSGQEIIGSSEAQRTNRSLRADSSFEVLDGMVTAVDNKDRYTRRHSEDVTDYALWIAEEIGVSEATMRVIRVAGLLHDVGKIGVPDEVLRKPGRLTAEEYEAMKRHPQLGALIVSGVQGMEPIVDAVRSHHERWDGQGYPDSLQGDEIPFLGRMLAVADAFSAMTTDRPYRQGLDWNTAMDEIRRNIGTQFDPFMAYNFLHAAGKRRNVPLSANPHSEAPVPHTEAHITLEVAMAS